MAKKINDNNFSFNLNGESFESLKWKIELANNICNALDMLEKSEYYFDINNNMIFYENADGNLIELKLLKTNEDKRYI